MLFNSPVFLVFLCVVVPLFYLLPAKFKKIFLLTAGYVFYGYWDWRFCLLLLFSSVMDYFLGHLIYAEQWPAKKKMWLRVSLLLNLSILGFFKYFNFFVASFAGVFGVQPDFLHLNVILPVGVSFYTFQSLSYTFDLYRNKMKPAKSLRDYCTFVSFFPQLVAGPIEKARDLLPQIEKLRRPDKNDIREGIVLITIGMFKKVMIGDTVGRYVDHVFANPGYYTSGELLCTLVLFSIQIYVDFSGYSKIAKGCAKLLGVTLMDNFNQPYFSSSITEFWRRWHISLSSWLREYVYIWWLGGNRKGKGRTYLNLMITMLLGGLWHGANWTFIIWGGIHGLALVIHKLFSKDKKSDFELLGKPIKAGQLTQISASASEPNESTKGMPGYLFNALLTYLVVLFAWLFFRSPDLSTAVYFLKSFLNWSSSALTGEFIAVTIAYFSVMLALDFFESYFKNHAYLLLLKPGIRWGIIIPVWITIILYMYTVGKPAPFIYFQF